MADFLREDRLLLEQLQGRFPLCARPYAELAERLGMAEGRVLERIRALKEGGPLRQIGAIFDTRRLGYASTLVAMAVEAERLDAVAEVVSRHPGVSHNYARAHRLNLWFTLAVPPGGDLEAVVRSLAAQPGVREVLSLPTLRAFKIDVRFDLVNGPEAPATRTATTEGREEGASQTTITKGTEETLAEDDIPFVRALQEDLPLVERPFAALAEAAGVDEAALIGAAHRLLAGGIMRRYGATLRHREAGYRANAMAVWQVPAARIQEAGRAAAGRSEVSHCYERPAYPPAWPYQLFTMVHARSQEELGGAVVALRELIRPLDAAVLPTVKEYKKARLRYFVE